LKKTQLIEAGEWQNNPLGNRGWSGKLKNPRKEYFLHLTADAVRDVNSERDTYGFSYARKDIIRCRLSLDVDGIWKVEQLFLHLQEIIAEHRRHFEGEPIPKVLLRED
jgi:hypothetical protein